MSDEYPDIVADALYTFPDINPIAMDSILSVPPSAVNVTLFGEFIVVPVPRDVISDVFAMFIP